jgi:hypothetical protein
VERYSPTKRGDGVLPQFFASLDSLPSVVREFFSVVHEVADYKFNIIPSLQEKADWVLDRLAKELGGQRCAYDPVMARMCVVRRPPG